MTPSRNSGAGNQRRTYSAVIVAVCCLWVSLWTVDARAYTNTEWIAGEGNWHNVYNWDNGIPSSTSYTAQVNNGGRTNITSDATTFSLTLGSGNGESGNALFSNGNLTVKGLTAGSYGTGLFRQTGGTVLEYLYGNITLGYGNNGHGTYELVSGDVSRYYEYVGQYGTGIFDQEGGNNTVTDFLWLGCADGGHGTYNLKGGTLSTNNVYLAGSSSGNPTAVFNHTDGNHTVGATLYLGGYHHTAANGNGTYNLSGGKLTAQHNIELGCRDTGTFYQTGGTAEIAGQLRMGYASAAEGMYILEGGILSAQSEMIGRFGTSNFTQTGGVNEVATSLYVGYDTSGDQSGSYSISGGALTTSNLYVGFNFSNATFDIADASAVITVSNELKFAENSTFTAVPGATIHMTGSNFENKSQTPENLSGLENLTLIFEGGEGVWDTFEVASLDVGGDDATGFDTNFALGKLQLGGDAGVGWLQLVDLFDNQVGIEALYVHCLVLGKDSKLDLNGIDLFYGSLTDQGCEIFLNGAEMINVPIPIPGAIWLLGSGLIGLVGFRRRFKK